MSLKPPNHARDHRPVGWLGSDDPGGADPFDWLTETGGHGPWITPTLVNGYSDVSPGSEAFQYRHAPGSPAEWEIEFRGWIDGPDDVYAWEFPAEDRPPEDKTFVLWRSEDGVAVAVGAVFIESSTGRAFVGPATGATGGGGGADPTLEPAVHVYHSANQSLTTSVDTALAFNSERFDTYNGTAATHHDTSTNNSRLTCLYAGRYVVIGGAEYESNTTGDRQLGIQLNGSTRIANVLSRAAGSFTTRLVVATIVELAVNDYVELFAFQNSGGNLNIVATSAYSPEFMMARVA